MKFLKGNWSIIAVIMFICSVAYAAKYFDEVNVDNINLNGNTISSTDTDGDLILDPNGTGGILLNDLTADSVPYLNGSKELNSSSISQTELEYLNGLTSAVVGLSDTQTLTNKTISGANNTLTIRDDDINSEAATSGHVLTADGANGASWVAASGGSGGSSGVNLVENGGFEVGDPPSNWTKTGAGTFVAESSTHGFGDQSGEFDASAASESICSDYATVPEGLEGRSCNATIEHYYPSGTAGDYTWKVEANTAGDITTDMNFGVTTEWTKSAIQFTCPSNDTIRVCVESTANGSPIFLDTVTAGRTDFVDISQTELVAHAHFEYTTNCSWDLTSTSFADFPTDSDCPAITVGYSSQSVDTTDTDLPQLVFDSLTPGVYHVQANHRHLAGTSGQNASYKLVPTASGGGSLTVLTQPESGMSTADVDGVAGMTEVSFEVTVAGPVTIKFQGRASSGQVRIYNADISATTSFKVVKYPTSSKEAVNLVTSGWHIDANIGGANIDLGTSNQAAYVTPNNSGLTLTQNSGSADVGISCSSTNDNTVGSTTCSAGNEEPGIVFNAPVAGRHEVCFSFSHDIQVASTSDDVLTTFQVIGTANGSQTIVDEGQERMTSALSNGGSTERGTYPHKVCGRFNYSTAGKKTVRLMYEQQMSGTPTTNVIAIDELAAQGQRDMNVTVRNLDAQQPTPVFTDLTTSLDSKLEAPSASDIVRVCSGQIDNNGSVSIDVNDLGCIDSLTRNATGQVTVDFNASYFSGVPTCTCSGKGTGGVHCISGSATANEAFFRTRDGSNADNDQNFNFICVGVK